MAEPLTPTAAPVASLSAPPAPPGAPEPLHLLDLRAVLLAALVLLVGAALGAAGYAAEQHYSSWLPKAVREGGGWRVVDAQGRRFSGLSLSGGHLAFQDGPLVLLLDLSSGRIRVLGPGPGDRSTWQPAASDRFVVWFEGQGANATRGETYVYDLSSRRRRPLGGVVRPASYAAASGARAVWTELSGGRSGRLVVLDLASSARSSIPAKPGDPLVDGGLVALKRGGPSGEVIVALDLGTRREWPVVAGDGGEMTGFGLSGRRVAWGSTDQTTGTGRVQVRDVDSGMTTLVATATGLAGPAIARDVVVWGRQSPGGGAEIVGRRLGGGPAFRIATVAGRVEAVQVSDGTAAWLLREDGSRTVIQTARLPR